MSSKNTIKVPEGTKIETPPTKPEIVCLCGSTRFMNAFFDEGWKLTLQRKIVVSIGVCRDVEHHAGEALGKPVVGMLDELHLRKIDLADRVMILNVGGYIGESTTAEMLYAAMTDKPIDFLEEPSNEVLEMLEKVEMDKE